MIGINVFSYDISVKGMLDQTRDLNYLLKKKRSNILCNIYC